MNKKAKKMPTAAELAFYRSKSVDGSYIGKNQLSAVFTALDAETARANAAEQQIHALENAVNRSAEEITNVYSWALTECQGGNESRYVEGVLVTLAWLSGEKENAPNE